MREKKSILKKLAALCLAAALIVSIAQPAAAASGYGFTYRGGTATPGSTATAFLKKAGQGKVKRNNSCAYKGYDITHTYSGFKVVTYTTRQSSRATEYVNNIVLTGKNVKTKEGLKVGDKESTIKRKYRSAKKSRYGSTYTVTKGKTKIQIKCSGKKVSSITYMKK